MIRRAKLLKIPYIVVVGPDDLEHGTVGVNRRGADTKPERGVSLEAFVASVVDEAEARRALPEEQATSA